MCEYHDDFVLDAIRYWPLHDDAGLIEYIQSKWHWSDYFKMEGRDLELHTGGWSGNESLIDALIDHPTFFTYLTEERPGGHYYFKLTNE